MAGFFQIIQPPQNGLPDLRIEPRMFQGLFEISDPVFVVDTFFKRKSIMALYGAVELVLTRDYLQHASPIRHRLSKDADDIEGGSIGNEPITRNAAIGGL